MPSAELLRRALLLDLDGTLADSLHTMRVAYAGFLGRFGRRADDAEFDSLNGPPLSEVVRRLQAAHGLPGRLDELVACYQSMVDAVYAEVSPMPGARELLAAAAAAGWAVGVVTSNTAGRTWQWLERAALARLVTFVVAGEDVARGKPHPDPYLAALARSGCGRERLVVVEDSPQGVAAALAAGLTTYAFEPGERRNVAWPAAARRLTRLQDLAAQLSTGSEASPA